MYNLKLICNNPNGTTTNQTFHWKRMTQKRWRYLYEKLATSNRITLIDIDTKISIKGINSKRTEDLAIFTYKLGEFFDYVAQTKSMMEE